MDDIGDAADYKSPPKRGRPKLEEPHECPCGYKTWHSSSMTKHKATCKVIKSMEKDEKEALLQEKNEEIRILKEQVAEKDRNITELIQIAKKHNVTINNNNSGIQITNNNLNVYGSTTVEHITDEQIQNLLSDPVNSVAGLARLRYQLPENQCVKIPNVRDKKRARVFKEVGGVKKWVYADCDETLEDMWEENMSLLEANVDESTPQGMRWCCWADKVRGDQGERGPRWKDQMSQLANTILDSTR